MFRPTRSLIITLRQVKDRRSLHRFSQQFSEVAEYECTFCLWLYFIVSCRSPINISLLRFYNYAAPITDEYKRGPLEGRSLYLDAQATTPMVWIII